jgi:DHA2 family multidrug resistance protein
LNPTNVTSAPNPSAKPNHFTHFMSEPQLHYRPSSFVNRQSSISRVTPITARPPPLFCNKSMQEPARINPWVVTVSVMLATFMEILDTTVVNVSIPHIAGNMGGTVEEGTWVVTSYLVSNAIILPMSAWLANYMGRRRMLLACVTGFTLTSLACGLAGSLQSLIFFRVLQGLSGGGMQPLAQAILLETFPQKKHGQAMAAYGIGILLAPIIGPTVGGWITDNYTWRWIFYLNLPVGRALPVSDQPLCL